MSTDACISPDMERRLRAVDARFRGGHTNRWLATQGLSAGVVLAGAVALAFSGGFSSSGLPVLGLTALLYLICRHLRVPVGAGYTVPTLLALVPMLLLVPAHLVGSTVVVCELIYVVLPTSKARIEAPLLAAQVADSAAGLGAALVLTLIGPAAFQLNAWPAYLCALGAYFICDALTYARYWFAERENPLDFAEMRWLHLMDACLACVAFPIAMIAAQAGVGLLLMLIPVLGMMKLFARERNARFDTSLALSDAYRGTAELLGDVIEDDDAYTAEHSHDVADLSLAVATRLGLDSVRRRNVEFGALLHDVGKVRVPHEILRKAGKLTDSEWAVMRQHTADGERMLTPLGGTFSEVGRIVRATHERFDGSGYPDGLAGAAIPIESRVIAACDAWNAMTTSRPYRRALSTEVAIEELRACVGTQFDPRVIRALLEEVGPPYAVAQLDAAALRSLSAA
ncbi:MAG: HD-GYP domain-containing protein [Solirubrobacterales bacterium]|nr:HD-GYP domain-containing protein [Solirubrobacterales bacterium]